MAPLGLSAFCRERNFARSLSFLAPKKIKSDPLAAVPSVTSRVRPSRSTLTPTYETRIPGLISSLSPSVGGLRILCAHLSACAPSVKSAVPTGDVTCSTPSAASSDWMLRNGIDKRKSPRKMSSPVSSSALPIDTLPPKRTSQLASSPIGRFLQRLIQQPRELVHIGFRDIQRRRNADAVAVGASLADQQAIAARGFH